MKKIMLLVTLLAVTLLGVGTLTPEKAEAYTLQAQSGYVGAVRIDEPGVGCDRYNSSYNQIYTSAPKIWAYPTYTGGQYVTYRVRIIRNNPWTDGGNFYNYSSTSWRSYKVAYPNSAAPYGTGPTIYVPRTNSRLNYRVLVDIRWYNNSGYVSGTRTLQPDYYWNIHLGRTVGPYGSCIFSN